METNGQNKNTDKVNWIFNSYNTENLTGKSTINLQIVKFTNG